MLHLLCATCGSMLPLQDLHPAQRGCHAALEGVLRGSLDRHQSTISLAPTESLHASSNWVGVDSTLALHAGWSRWWSLC